MKYTIGEFASILGVTVDTLRLYEKHGIIQPSKNQENNYRYFTDLDARDLLMSRWYRSMEIPLQDTALLSSEASLDYIMEKINESQNNLEAEMKRIQLLLSKVKKINKELRDIKPSLNQCKVKQLPGIYRIKQTDQNALLKESHLRTISNVWMDMLPHSFFSFRIEKEEILHGESLLDFSWGLAIYENEIHNFDVKIKDTIEYLPPRTYISSVVFSKDNENITRETLKFILDYFEVNNLSIDGDIFGKILANEKINGESNFYTEVNFPFKSSICS